MKLGERNSKRKDVGERNLLGTKEVERVIVRVLERGSEGDSWREGVEERESSISGRSELANSITTISKQPSPILS